jgi:hypothetical protein
MQKAFACNEERKKNKSTHLQVAAQFRVKEQTAAQGRIWRYAGSVTEGLGEWRRMAEQSSAEGL